MRMDIYMAEFLPCSPETITILLTGYISIQNELPCGSGGQESACNVGDSASIPGSGRSPEEGNG